MTDATLAFGFLAAVVLGIVVLVASRARAAQRQDQQGTAAGGDIGWMSGDVSGGSSAGDGDGNSGSDGCDSGSGGDSGGGDSGCDSGGGDGGGGDGGGGGD